jgi:hypothetical protein
MADQVCMPDDDEPQGKKRKKLDPKSIAKQVEEMKAEAAPAPIITGATSKPYDIFEDDEAFAVSQDFIEAAGVEPTIIDVSVCKRPDADDWVRVHPGEDFRRTVTLLEHKRRIYLLTKPVAETLPPEEYFCATLYFAITRENEPFLWYVKEKPDAGHDWFHSAAECVTAAMKGFVRVRTGAKGYKCANIKVTLPAPKWPKENFKQILKLAFKDWLIDKPDHEILLKRRGLL